MPTSPQPSTRAYVAVNDGEAVAIFGVDDQESAIAAIRSGCVLHPVTIEVARRALFQRWPLEEPDHA